MTEATKYRKKPVEIEAMHYVGGDSPTSEQLQSGRAIVAWIGPDKATAFDSSGGPYVLIETLEGTMRATPGDYIIKGVQGEFYPCKPDIFAATYDEGDGPIEADTYDGYMGGFKKGDRVKHWNGRTIGTVLRIFKKSKQSLWYIDVDRLGKAGTIELKASDCQKVGA